MNQVIDSWLNNNNLTLSHSPLLFGIIYGAILGTSISVTSFISLRRLIIQGVPAGIVSYLGSAIAETIFLGFIMFGSLSIIDSWVIVEPSLKVFITIFCFDTIFSFLRDKRLKIVSFDQTLDLVKIFLCNAIIVVANPASILTASTLLTSVESFEFRENVIFLIGIFFGLFCMSLIIGFSILGLTYLWMARSTKSFQSLIYRFNKGISTLTLTLLFLSVLNYHVSVYIATSFTTWANPLLPSPSLIVDEEKERKLPFSYQPYQNDIRGVKAFSYYQNRINMKTNQSKFIKKVAEYVKKEQDKSEIKKSQNSNPFSKLSRKIESREKKWFSRSQFFTSIKDKIATVFNLKKEKLKFYQDSSFVDLVDTKSRSPLLVDKTSKRILVRQLTAEEFIQLQNIREKRIQELKKFF